MNSDKKVPRLLGAAFLVVALVSLMSGFLLMSVLGSASNISDILVNISKNPTLMHFSIVGQVVTSLAIVVLAVLLYIVLNKRNKIIALVALGWWLAEAIFLAISQLGTFALIPLSQKFAAAGAPANSFYQTLGEFLYYGVYTQGYTTHFLFYCAGGVLWYYLFYESKYVPRVISLWGLIAVSVSIVGIVFQFFSYDVPIFIFLPILPFELAIGVWLIVKGIRDGSETEHAVSK